MDISDLPPSPPPPPLPSPPTATEVNDFISNLKISKSRRPSHLKDVIKKPIEELLKEIESNELIAEIKEKTEVLLEGKNLFFFFILNLVLDVFVIIEKKNCNLS